MFSTKIKVRMREKRLLILLFILTLVSCNNSYDYRITNLDNSTVKYSELPTEIKKIISNPDPSLCAVSQNISCDLYCLDKGGSYEIETFHYRFLPQAWIAYLVLTDRDKQTSYRIETNQSMPYIIFKNKLYIANEYNFIGTNENSETANNLSFTCYNLK